MADVIFVGRKAVAVSRDRIAQRRLADPESQPVPFTKNVPDGEDLNV